MKRLALAILLNGMALAHPLSQSDMDWCKLHCTTIRVGVERDYPPYSFVDEHGQPSGLSVQLLKAVAAEAGLSLQWMPPQPLPVLLQQIRRREIDVLTIARPTPERAEYLGFTRPYVNVPVVVVVPRISEADKLEDLSGKRVGIGRGYAVESYARQHYPAIDWVITDSDSASLGMLERRQLDAVVGDTASMSWHLRGHVSSAQIRSPIGYRYPYALAWRSDWPELGHLLDDAQLRISSEQEREIVQLWLGNVHTRPWQMQLLPEFIGSGMVLGGIALLLWSRRSSQRKGGSV
ncbi:transporter substrate-binding domain-containing protein [Chitinimonas sp.]|uniref:transporter substrate-binding domain-containing protein n=1 Tax=Chitinimonas sp. TaxID=1934313 RepID=UPI0035B2A9B5